MDEKSLMQELRQKFSKIPFFVRVFKYNNKIIIWNDHDIKLSITFNELKALNLDEYVENTKSKFLEKINHKYKNFNNKKISVIIPNYNNEHFIKKTIDSILNSTYKDIEIIFIDDCSTDSSLEVVKSNFGSNPKVRIYQNKKNQGAYYNRNKGILLSTGYYITFVDGDDFIHRDKLAYERGNLEGLNRKAGRTKYWNYGTSFIRLFIKDNNTENILKKQKSWSATYVFYRKFYNMVGFYANNRFGADTEMWKRAENFGYKYYANRNKHMYYAYTQEGKNLTRTIGEGERWKWMHQREKIFKARGYIEMALLDNTEDFVELLEKSGTLLETKKNLTEALLSIIL